MRYRRRVRLALETALLRLRVPRAFTIISNNCWGAHVYQRLGIPYQTPFVGLFVPPDDYLRMLGDLRSYLAQPLGFIPTSHHAYTAAFRVDHAYPIGVLGDVEIHFLHYADEAEARATWERRVQRVTPDDRRIFVKFCERDATADHLRAFDSLPLPHRVCFVSETAPPLRSAVVIPGGVPDGYQLSKVSPRVFDAASWLRGSARRWPLRCV